MKFEAEEIVLRRSLVFIGMRQQFVPDVERVLFEFPSLFATEVRDRSVEVQILRRQVLASRGRVIRDLAGRRMPGKWNQAALGQAVEETLKVFLLFRGKRRHGSRIEIQLRFHAAHPEEGLGTEA